MANCMFLWVVALIAAAHFSSARAFNPARSKGLHGRKPLFQSTAQIMPKRERTSSFKVVAVHQVGDTILGDYGPPERNPPYHEDPPTPFTQVGDTILGDYGPPERNPPYHEDPPTPFTQVGDTILGDYGPPERNPPYHEDPPTPFTRTS